MWNKRNEEEFAPKPVAPRPVAVPPAPAPRQAASLPHDEPKTAGRATIGPSMTVKGEVYSREELYVDGEIQGSIELHHRLTIGPNRKIRPTLKAKEVELQG